MKFSAAAVLAAAAGVSAGYSGNVTYVTEVVEDYTTYCPGPTQITQGGKTYTITEATTFTITACKCTVTRPVVTTSAVVCHDCPKPTQPGYTNSTLVVVPSQPGKPTGGEQPKPTGTGSGPAPTGKPSSVPVAGAGKVALSGAGLAGVVGLAAFFL